jgi:hypothetical protein
MSNIGSLNVVYDRRILSLYGAQSPWKPRSRVTMRYGKSGYADAAASRTASVAHAARRSAATVISAPANGQHGEQRS